MELDFSPLRKATARLDEGLRRHLAEPDDIQVRDGLIQRFEFTYELSHKSLRRALEAASPSPEDIDQMTFPALVRTGWEQGLVAGDWPAWKHYREMRSITSHTYDEEKAREVVAVIPMFLAEVQDLLGRLERRFPS